MKLAILATALALSVPTFARAAEVWRINSDIGGAMYDETCTLAFVDGKIDGQCVAKEVPEPIKTHGTFTAAGAVRTVDFAYDVTVNGQTMHVAFSGRSQPDGALKGKVDASGLAGTFTATPAANAP